MSNGLSTTAPRLRIKAIFPDAARNPDPQRLYQYRANPALGDAHDPTCMIPYIPDGAVVMYQGEHEGRHKVKPAPGFKIPNPSLNACGLSGHAGGCNTVPFGTLYEVELEDPTL